MTQRGVIFCGHDPAYSGARRREHWDAVRLVFGGDLAYQHVVVNERERCKVVGREGCESLPGGKSVNLGDSSRT